MDPNIRTLVCLAALVRKVREILSTTNYISWQLFNTVVARGKGRRPPPAVRYRMHDGANYCNTEADCWRTSQIEAPKRQSYSVSKLAFACTVMRVLIEVNAALQPIVAIRLRIPWVQRSEFPSTSCTVTLRTTPACHFSSFTNPTPVMLPAYRGQLLATPWLGLACQSPLAPQLGVSCGQCRALRERVQELHPSLSIVFVSFLFWFVRVACIDETSWEVVDSARLDSIAQKAWDT